MSYSRTNISAAPVGDANGYLASTDMKVGAYTLIANVPTFGARHVTCTRTVVGNADTPGTLVLVGKDLSGQAITETLTVGAHTVVVTSTKFFSYLTSATGAGWVIDPGTTTKDTLEIGWDDLNAVATGSGTFHGIVVNTTAAGSITVADSGGTIAVLKASIAEGFYGPYDVAFSGYLRVEPVAASDITVIHSGSMPQTYAMS
jgi:hypothetical protein